MPKLDELLDACSGYTLSEQVARNDNIVIPEAYIPYFPPNWNGYLVLGEAQNLSNHNNIYVQELKKSQPRDRMNRLARRLAVAPWDDGALPCAVEAAFRLNAGETAVSNAVPWSRTTPNGNGNQAPSDTMIYQAVHFWTGLLPLIKPAHIITAGRVAQQVISDADRANNYPRSSIRLPSPQAMSRISSMFEVDDLLARFPEVARVVKARPAWFETYKRNKVFFACHAVSLYGRQNP